MTGVKRPATGARAHTPCKDLSKAVDGGRIQCAVLHVPLSLPTNEGGERDGQPVCALLTALACDLLETTRTATGGGCEFGVCLYCDLRAEGVERCSTALPVARSCSSYIVRYAVAD